MAKKPKPRRKPKSWKVKRNSIAYISQKRQDRNKDTIENVAIAMHCNLNLTVVVLRFNEPAYQFQQNRTVRS